MKTKYTHSFDSMPRDYAGLCRVFLPRPIHDRAGYENTVEVADVFAGHEDRMSDGQNDYFDLLCDLVEKYETETVPAPKLKSLALLKHLVEEHSLSGADLSRILGKSLPLGPMILRGERKITAAHAVILGKRFGLRADAFIS
ncbi:type II toxin-antitoxin system HigA family antitoxin [Haloferula chungangensis]|uniref:Type II toxin-antitoxin system HigA family antitoxin n=1 Tax=Haloferula chungangensis TaxID=1048331 RepID=A0ABW2LD92_9BACT